MPAHTSLARPLAVALLAMTPGPALAAPQTWPDGAARQIADDLVERVQAGGDVVTLRTRRGPLGGIEVECPDLDDRAAWRPLLDDDLEQCLRSAGPIGWLALVCHGDSDLLGMTAAAVHLRYVGVDVTESALRRFIGGQLPAQGSPGRRGAMFERMLAVDVLRRRGCTEAIPDLLALAGSDAPAPLRERARDAAARLDGDPPTIGRRRLDPENLHLPASYDVAIVIDHARLPDLGPLTAVGRRLGLLVVAARVRQQGHGNDHATSLGFLQGGQVMADACGELPFGAAMRWGNARVDHSLALVTLRADVSMPVAVTWHAAGTFDPERLQQLEAPAAIAAAMPRATLDVDEDQLRATTDGSRGRPRPELAMELLADTGAAIRVIVPGASKLWGMAAMAGLPAPRHAELSMVFGDPATLVLRISARDEEGAAAWAEWLEERDAVPTELSPGWAAFVASGDPLVERLNDTISGGIEVEAAEVIGTFEYRGVTWELLAETAERAARSL